MEETMQKNVLRVIFRSAALTLVVGGLAACASVPTESAEAVLQRANTAMGGAA